MAQSFIAEKHLSEERCNAADLVCPRFPRCRTVIVAKNVGQQVQGEKFYLPSYHKDSAAAESREAAADGAAAEESVHSASVFWELENQFAFENVGVTKPDPNDPAFSAAALQEGEIGTNKRYLACAECELGPIGLAIFDRERGKQRWLVAVDRVLYRS